MAGIETQKQKCTAKMRKKSKYSNLILIDLCTRLDWAGAFRKSADTWIKSELYPGRWKQHLVMNQFCMKHAGTKALSITRCYISLYSIMNTFMRRRTPDCNFIRPFCISCFCKVNITFHNSRKTTKTVLIPLCASVTFWKHFAFLHCGGQFERTQN